MVVKIDKTNSNFCDECYGTVIHIPEIGEIVCSQCGLVIDERRIDTRHSSKRAYTQQEHNSREQVGSLLTPLTPKIALHTVIETNKINNPDLKRAAKWNTRMSWEERNILMATTELKRISSNLELPNYVRDSAIKIYKENYKKNGLRGRSINAMVAACIYYACRKSKVNRTFNEILNESSCREKIVRSCYSVLMRNLNLKVPVIDITSLVPKYITKLNLNPGVEKMVKRILEPCKNSMEHIGKDPKGLCAGAIYLACKLNNLKIKQDKIAEVTGVSVVTVRSRYREFLMANSPCLLYP